jgi:hypothetical protein
MGAAQQLKMYTDATCLKIRHTQQNSTKAANNSAAEAFERRTQGRAKTRALTPARVSCFVVKLLHRVKCVHPGRRR